MGWASRIQSQRQNKNLDFGLYPGDNLDLDPNLHPAAEPRRGNKWLSYKTPCSFCFTHEVLPLLLLFLAIVTGTSSLPFSNWFKLHCGPLASQPAFCPPPHPSLTGRRASTQPVLSCCGLAPSRLCLPQPISAPSKHSLSPQFCLWLPTSSHLSAAGKQQEEVMSLCSLHKPQDLGTKVPGPCSHTINTPSQTMLLCTSRPQHWAQKNTEAWVQPLAFQPWHPHTQWRIPIASHLSTTPRTPTMAPAHHFSDARPRHPPCYLDASINTLLSWVGAIVGSSPLVGQDGGAWPCVLHSLANDGT